jgi:hypothetical protein
MEWKHDLLRVCGGGDGKGLWEDTHTGCVVFPLSRCRRTEIRVCVDFQATAKLEMGK